MTEDAMKALAENAVADWLHQDNGGGLRYQRIIGECGPEGLLWIDAFVAEVVRALAAERDAE